jgi:hypothetical protein
MAEEKRSAEENLPGNGAFFPASVEFPPYLVLEG